MAERRITLTLDIDLAKGSKEAHAVTIERIARQVAQNATELIEAAGYTVRRSKVTTVLHYVRHTLKATLKEPKVKRLKKVI